MPSPFDDRTYTVLYTNAWGEECVDVVRHVSPFSGLTDCFNCYRNTKTIPVFDSISVGE